MVDTRLRGEWLNTPRFDDLSDRAWRIFTLGMMWSNQQGTDGLVPPRYVRTIHPEGEFPEAVGELVEAGFAEIREDGSLNFIDWTGLGQSTAEYVAGLRKANADRQQAYRDRQRLTRDSATRDVTRYVGTGIGNESSTSPDAYVSSDVTRYDKCSRHPNGDTGEPCRGCAQVAAAKKATTRSEADALEKRCRLEGHWFEKGDRYCRRCTQQRDPNAWMEPRPIAPITDDTTIPSYPPIGATNA